MASVASSQSCLRRALSTRASTRGSAPVPGRISSTAPSRLPQSFSSPSTQFALASRGGPTWLRDTPSPARNGRRLIVPRLNPASGARHFSTTRSHLYKTIQQAQARHRSGPFSWRAALLFLLSGGSLLLYFRYEKTRLERARIASLSKGAGAPRVGGAFTLLDHNKRPFTDRDLRGKYSLVYFGFTHCPDICPEELDKMATMLELVAQQHPAAALRPVFITCDPARDSPAVLATYLREFHPRLVGLTGTWEQVKQACKAYRVYFSTPEGMKGGEDYLVDHSIYFYLMDPQGDFVEAIGRQFSAERAAEVIAGHIGDWKGELDLSAVDGVGK